MPANLNAGRRLPGSHEVVASTGVVVETAAIAGVVVDIIELLVIVVLVLYVLHVVVRVRVIVIIVYDGLLNRRRISSPKTAEAAIPIARMREQRTNTFKGQSAGRHAGCRLGRAS